MTRGELYRVYRGSKTDSKDYRVFVIVSRQILIDSRFSTVICAPIYSKNSGLSTQVSVGIGEGLKAMSAIHTDELVSIQKNRLTHYIGKLDREKLDELGRVMAIAIGIT